MANPRIEEISDDEDMAADPDEVDLDTFDFSRPQQGSLQSTMNASSQMRPEDVSAILQPSSSQTLSGSRQPSQSQQIPNMNISDAERDSILRDQQRRTKHHQCIYPIYFDSTRSRQDGRRVKKEDAVPNPLARELVDALQHVGQSLNLPLQIAFEPSKCHPKDWANPGRVRVLVKEDGKAVSAKLANKHQLYKLISTYLKQHPTTENMPLRFRPQGLPMPKDGKEYVPPAVPKGFKMGTILPLHSPALSGGGVSDNFLKDMMSEMGGQLPPGMEGMAGLAGAGGGGGGPPKKVKKGKK